MKDDFVTANTILRDLGVEYWMACGTLLGAIREGDFLAHDKDFDFFCTEWQRHERIEQEMSDHFRCESLGTPDYGYEQCFFRHDEHIFDIFYFYPVDDTRSWSGSWANGKVIWSEYVTDDFLPVQPYVFQGQDTFIPHHPEKALTARYGDWTVPVTSWDYSKDPRCIREARF